MPPTSPDVTRGAEPDEPLRVADLEETVEPGGSRPDGAVDDEDAREDIHDVDELADAESRTSVAHGRGPQDRPNFDDNAAEWSREGS